MLGMTNRRSLSGWQQQSSGNKILKNDSYQRNGSIENQGVDSAPRWCLAVKIAEKKE